MKSYKSPNGKIELLHMDCMDYLKSCSENEFDLLIADPPYGINVTAMNMGSRQTIKPNKSKDWDMRVPDDSYFSEAVRVSKRQIIWGGNYFNLPCSKYFAIWDKGDTMYGRSFAECEYAWVSSGGTRIFKHSPNQLDRIHETQKPVRLYEWLLVSYAEHGDRILDTHGGSMSSMLACHNGGFDAVCCEIDKDYFNAGKERLDNHKKQLIMF